MGFQIVSNTDEPCTRVHASARDAWRELIPELPEDGDALRRETLRWVGRGYRVVEVYSGK